MNFSLLNPDIQEFIKVNLNVSVAKLAFKTNPFPYVDYKEILNQIEGKQKTEIKLPTWYKTNLILYPSKISLEQTSSEITAQYKATLANGNTILDASGGFGIDDFYFAKKFNQVTHCEIQGDLSKIVAYNFKQLGVSNCKFVSQNSTDYLKENTLLFDTIYIDPARRNADKKKVFFLEDCEPNVPKLLDFYFQFSDIILVKTSPLLDITSAVNSLKNISEVHIVAVNNDVKELIFKIEKNFDQKPSIKTINFGKEKLERLDFDLEIKSTKSYSNPKKYLYEPNNAIMKSGKFEEVSSYFDVFKLNFNSHLYTNDEIIDFPGRVFKIEKEIVYNKKEIQKYLTNQKANVTVRNFPETVETLRKKWKIKDGGNLYCFFTTNKENAKIVLLCTKLN
jgi:hypothetical protein